MGGLSWLAVSVGVASLLMSVQCSTSCKGAEGHPGVIGSPGRDGLIGEKGEKGEPAVNAEGPLDPGTLMKLRGEIGSRGQQGTIGPKGYRGDLGAPGKAGNPGLPGPDGKNLGGGDQNSQEAISAFSVVRNETSYPQFKRTITYQHAVVNKPGDFDIATGEFTCRIPGVYYFNFHSYAKVSMCLNIVSPALNKPLGFCDYSKNNEQVFTGGVVLELTANQKVWLEPIRERQSDIEVRDTRAKQITFNGFLLFRNTN